MSIDNRWTVLLAACGGAAVALALSTRRRHRRHAEKRAYKADVHEWENEGGNLAPPATLSDSTPTAASA